MMLVFMFGSVCTMFLGERSNHKLYQSLQSLQKGNSEKGAVEEFSFTCSVL